MGVLNKYRVTDLAEELWKSTKTGMFSIISADEIDNKPLSTVSYPYVIT